MYNDITINLMETLSFLLVISFFIMHNIYFVIIGISLAYYLIRKKKLDILAENKKKEIIKNEIKIIDSKQMKNKCKKPDDKDSILTLVDVIEEFGYIPSANTKDDSKAA